MANKKEKAGQEIENIKTIEAVEDIVEDNEIEVEVIEEYNDLHYGYVQPGKKFKVNKERYEILSNPDSNCYMKILVKKVED